MYSVYMHACMCSIRGSDISPKSEEGIIACVTVVTHSSNIW